MKIDQFESDEKRQGHRAERPWRKDAPPLNKPATDPNYPKTPFNHTDWMKSSKPMEEDSDIPVPGDTVRTTKLEGKVSKVEEGYVYFTTADGRNMRNTIQNCTVIEKLADQECNICEDEILDEVSTELLAKYKKAAGKDATDADKKGNFKRGDKRFSGIVKATNKQFDNDAKKKTDEGFRGGVAGAVAGATITKSPSGAMTGYKLGSAAQDLLTQEDDETYEGTMGGINRSAPSNDVSYEKVLDEVYGKWNEEQVNELSVDKLRAYKDAAKSPASFKNRPLRKLAKTIQGVKGATDRIDTKTGARKQGPGPERGNNESVSTDEAITPWGGYTADDPKANALAKAPKSSMQGKGDVRFSELVQDAINKHGVKWAFDYYVKKHGLPPRQFQIFAGLTTKSKAAEPAKPDWTDPPTTTKPKQSWWQKLRGKLPFEE